MSYKVIIFPLAGVGHINPIVKIASELIKAHNARVIIYSLSNFKHHIESIGAEYCTLDDKVKYEDEVLAKISEKDTNLSMIYKLMDSVYSSVDKYSLQVSEILERERPDMVLYDNIAIFAKVALEILNQKYKNKKTNKAPPLSIALWTTVTSEEKIYPNDVERKNGFNLTKFQLVRLLVSAVVYTFRFKRLFRRLGVPFPGIRNFVEKDPSVLNLVLVSPGLHPRAHLYDSKSTRFVGACISDDVHVTAVEKRMENNEISDLLNSFPVINPSFKYTPVEPLAATEQQPATKKLVYVSLGTVHSDNNRIYSILIDAFRTLDDGENSIKPDNLTIIIALGQKLYNQLKSSTIPKNIILAPSAPQLEVLKRASLFITHAGMNSTSESVHYGVPMICLPIHGDQPSNAYRIHTDLGLGIRLNIKTVTPVDIKNAIHKVLGDSSYSERCNVYARISAEHIGHKNAARIIIDCIEKLA